MIAEYCLMESQVVLLNAPLTCMVSSRVASECSGSADGEVGVVGIDNTCGRVRPIVITASKLNLSKLVRSVGRYRELTLNHSRES